MLSHYRCGRCNGLMIVEGRIFRHLEPEREQVCLRPLPEAIEAPAIETLDDFIEGKADNECRVLRHIIRRKPEDEVGG